MANSFFESNNPILGEETYQKAARAAGHDQSVMTVNGAVNKSLILGVILMATASISWTMPSPIFLWGGLIGGIICVLVSTFRPQYSAITAPLYAVFEGLCLGALSAFLSGSKHFFLMTSVRLSKPRVWIKSVTQNGSECDHCSAKTWPESII